MRGLSYLEAPSGALERLQSPATTSLELESEVVFDSERGSFRDEYALRGFERCLPGPRILECSSRRVGSRRLAVWMTLAALLSKTESSSG